MPHSYTLQKENSEGTYKRDTQLFTGENREGWTGKPEFSITHIIWFLKKERKLPKFMVKISSDKSNKEVFNLKALFYIITKVKEYKTTGPALNDLPVKVSAILRSTMGTPHIVSNSENLI